MRKRSIVICLTVLAIIIIWSADVHAASWKDWLGHPINNFNQYFDSVRQSIVNDIGQVSKDTQEKIQNAIDTKIGVASTKAFMFFSNMVSLLFEMITYTVVVIPVELVANETVLKLYLTMMVIAIACSVLFVLYNCLLSLLDDSKYISISGFLGGALKNVLSILLMPFLFIILIGWSNLIAKSVLTIGYKQIEVNTIIALWLNKNNMVGFEGVIIAIIVMIALGGFLLIVFFHTCYRYWQTCKLFVLGPFAIALGTVPATNYIYLLWQSKIKYILSSQILYAIHLTIFTLLMSIPFTNTKGGALYRVMILIGGMYDLVKLPGGLAEIFAVSNEGKSASMGKRVISTFIANKFGGGKK